MFKKILALRIISLLGLLGVYTAHAIDEFSGLTPPSYTSCYFLPRRVDYSSPLPSSYSFEHFYYSEARRLTAAPYAAFSYSAGTQSYSLLPFHCGYYPSARGVSYGLPIPSYFPGYCCPFGTSRLTAALPTDPSFSAGTLSYNSLPPHRGDHPSTREESHGSQTHAHSHSPLGETRHSHSHQSHCSHGHSSSHRHSPDHLYIPDNEASRSLLLEAGLRDGMSVLEVGCGPGLMTPWLAQITPHGRVTAFDINDSYITTTQEKCGTYPNVTVFKSSVFDLEDEKRYGLIYCRLVLHHVSDHILAIKKVVNLLEPEGILVCEELPSFPVKDIMQRLGLNIIIERSCPSAERNQLAAHREAMGFTAHHPGTLERIPLGSFIHVVGRKRPRLD